jgi:pantothenate kinase type III
MILGILIGNTNTRLYWFEGTAIRHRLTVRTDARPHIPQFGRLEDGAVASVVPAAVPGWVAAVRRALGPPQGLSPLGRPTPGLVRGRKRPLVVSPRTCTGLRFRYPRTQLGVDRVCVAAGARRLCSDNVIAVDFGTAVTVNVVRATGVFAGGYILPGPDAMFAALHSSTALLPLIRTDSLDPAPFGLPTYTDSAIRYGVRAAVAGGVNLAINWIERTTRLRFRVIATGGSAADFRAEVPRISSVEPHLAAHGLAAIYWFSRPPGRVE